MATFGGVPTNVAMPPRLAAYAVPRSNAEGKLGWRVMSILDNTDIAMGSIIRVVAVLEIHMLRPAVASINPAMSLLGLPPAATNTFKANRRCKFQRSKAMAMRNPPRNKKTYFDP